MPSNSSSLLMFNFCMQAVQRKISSFLVTKTYLVKSFILIVIKLITCLLEGLSLLTEMTCLSLMNAHNPHPYYGNVLFSLFFFRDVELYMHYHSTNPPQTFSVSIKILIVPTSPFYLYNINISFSCDSM
jgi:hypothetical protein